MAGTYTYTCLSYISPHPQHIHILNDLFETRVIADATNTSASLFILLLKDVTRNTAAPYRYCVTLRALSLIHI